jgi:hypothetical protein
MANPSFSCCDAQGRTSKGTRYEMPPQWLKRTEQSIPEGEESNDRERPSGKEEGTLRHCRADSGSRDCQESSCVSHWITGTRGLSTVEVSAPTEVEVIVP